jgi:hypothetical protein
LDRAAGASGIAPTSSGGFLGSLVFKPLRWMRNASLRQADMNVAIGELMADRLLQLDVERKRICVIPNWADGDALKPVERSANALRGVWQTVRQLEQRMINIPLEGL